MIDYYLLTKPGIIFGNLLTVAAGFVLASNRNIDPYLFVATLLSLSLVIASACVFNNYIDRKIDQKMNRTKKRALAQGLISNKNAIFFGIVLGLFGVLCLTIFTNILTVCIALLGYFVYVAIYSLCKSRTIYATAIGSIAGAVPPVVGYCAISNQFDLGALLFFLIMVSWQMPHFFSIAVYCFEDYKAASIPVLPIKKGLLATKKHMLIYILIFMSSIFLLTLFGYTGFTFLSVSLVLGLIWFTLCLLGFKSKNDEQWARSMFRFSLIAITGLSIMIPIDIYTNNLENRFLAAQDIPDFESASA